MKKVKKCLKIKKKEVGEKPAVILIEDDKELAEQIKFGLRQEYEIHIGSSLEEWKVLYLQTKSPFLILDLGLPPNPNSPVVGL